MSDDAVSLQEAARITGLSTDALRLRWRRGTLSGYKSGRRLFLYKSSLPGFDRSSERSEERSTTERDRSEEIALLRAQIETKDEQISRLLILLGQAQQQLLPPPATVPPPATEPTERPIGWWRRWRQKRKGPSQ